MFIFYEKIVLNAGVEFFFFFKDSSVVLVV